MKRLFIALLLVAALLMASAPALASTFGVSPSSVEIEVPTNGTIVQEFTLTGEGNVQIYLEGIPLSISPSEVEISGSEVVPITFYGDGTNNSYTGEIRFLNMQGGNVGAGIIVHLTVHVNCTATIVEPILPSGGGGGGPALYLVTTNLFGVETTYYSEYYGVIQKTIEGTSEDGNLTITIPKGTTTLDKDGKRLGNIDIVVNDNPPAPPAGANVIGLPYTLSPNGATFYPSMTMTWNYNPDDVPDGVAEGDLVLAFYDEVAGEWVELTCTVDTTTHAITASVSHFTVFAILAKLPSSSEPELPPVEPLVVSPITPELVPPTTPDLPVPEETVPQLDSTPTEQAPSEGFSVSLLVGIVVVVVVLGIGVFWVVWRRRRA